MTKARDNAAVGEEFASGTKMIFNQTASPTGWTKVTGSGNDHALRVTTGTVGTGGSVAFETAFASQTPTISTPTITMSNDPVTLGETQIPGHKHGTYGATGASAGPNNTTTTGAGYVEFVYTQSGTIGQPHTHANTASSSAPTSSAINLDVSYVDVIIATKD
tara:strand:+ start:35 stop:520 length:486 start_codon:yes stop_codon:yes gene_type:complete